MRYLLELKNEQWGLMSKPPKSAPSRFQSAGDRLMKEAKEKAEQEEFEKPKLRDTELSTVLHFLDTFA